MVREEGRIEQMLKIISTGLEGPERSALDAAIELKCPWGGTTSLGRSGHFAPIPERYFTPSEFGVLVEGSSSRPMQSRSVNAAVADGTLILRWANLIVPPLCKQTMISLRHARGKYKAADPTRTYEVAQVVKWISESGIETLNISSDPKDPDDPFTKRSIVFMRDIITFTLMYQNHGVKIWTDQVPIPNQK